MLIESEVFKVYILLVSIFQLPTYRVFQGFLKNIFFIYSLNPLKAKPFFYEY